MTDFLFSNFANSILQAAVDSDDTELIIRGLDAGYFPSPSAGQAFAVILWDGSSLPEVCYCTVRDEDTLTVTRGEEGTTATQWLAGTQVRHALTRDTIGNILQQNFFTGHIATESDIDAGTSDLLIVTPNGLSYFWAGLTTTLSRQLLAKTTEAEMRRILGWASVVFSGDGVETVFDLGEEGYDNQYTKVYVDESFVTSSNYTISGTTITFDSPPDAGSDNIVVVLGTDFAFSVSAPSADTVSTEALQDEAVTTAKIKDLNVTEGKLDASAVTVNKLGDGAVATGKIADSAVTTDKLAANSVTTDKVSDAAITASKLASGAAFVVGMVLDYGGSTAPSGWLLCYGQAISRSTYSALFAVLGTTFGTGDGSTTFNLPDCRGRTSVGKDNMGGTSANRLTGQSGGINGDNLGATGGVETHQLTVAQMPQHRHYTPASSTGGGSGAYMGSTAYNVGYPNVYTDYQGSNGAHNNVQPSIVFSKIIYAGV